MGQVAEAAVTQAETVALNWLTWELTGSALAIGLVNLSRFIPLVVVGLAGGVIADGFDKRTILFLTGGWG